MAPERIFQGRQRGILELAEGKSHLYPQSRQSSHLDPAFGKICLQPFSTCPNRKTHTPKHRSSVPPPAPVDRRAGATNPLQSAYRGVPWTRQTPGIDPRKGAPPPLPAPGEARSRQLRIPEKAGQTAVSGCRWEASPLASRAARRAGHLSYRCGPRLPARADRVRL